MEIQQARPVISATLEGLPDAMFVGEQVGGTLVIRNDGKIAFGGVQLFVNKLGCLRLAKGDQLESLIFTKLMQRYRT